MSENCNDTNIPAVDDTALECCEIHSTNCIVTAEAVPCLAVGKGSTLTKLFRKLCTALTNLSNRVAAAENTNFEELIVDISSNEIRTASSSAVLIIPAPGAGKYIELISVFQKYSFSTLPYKGAGVTNLRYVDEAFDIAFYIGGNLDTSTGDYFIRGQHYDNESISINKGIEWFTQGDSVDGLGTIRLRVTYRILDEL
jgi:hypothetical protein